MQILPQLMPPNLSLGALCIALILALVVPLNHASRLTPGNLAGLGVQVNVKHAENTRVVHELPDLTAHPIICILTQPGDLADPGESYLSAGYVKWLEAAGARVAPILFDMGEGEITDMFNMCNGVVFPGGNYPLTTQTTWFKAGELLVQLAREANDKGRLYPVLGTCLGLQLLATIETRDQFVLVPLNAANHPSSLHFTEAIDQSALIKQVPAATLNALTEQPIAMFNHHFGLVDRSFELYPQLAKSYDILSHTVDWDNTSYVSMIGAKRYPFLGVAFHAEKVPYEWTPSLDIPHSREAVEASFQIASAFVALARRNNHRGKDLVEEDARLIYNWNPSFTGKHETGDENLAFEQAYLFRLNELQAAS
mmetsp:Transcript_11129/g.19429  ORF Transcript_11129/g.19429 Transcript_11129/m.19429 type:complete len:367 (+) Transcript_11129:56-1156(+)